MNLQTVVLPEPIALNVQVHHPGKKAIITSLSQHRKGLLLSVILLSALMLRLWHINQPYVDAISWRQASTAMIAENFFKNNSNILYPEINWSGPGPSYNGREFQTITYITSLLYHLFGQHDWVGRIVAVAFGVWGVFALYNLVRRVWDEKHALAAAGVMAIMPLSVFVERSFIPDPAMVSLVTTFLWMFIAYLQTDRKSYLVFAVIVGCLGFLTKLPGMLVGLPAVYAIITILSARRKLTVKRLLFLLRTGLLAIIPVIGYYLWARHLSLTYPPYHFAGEGNWLWDEGMRAWIKESYFISRTNMLAVDYMWGAPILFLFAIALLFPPPYSKLQNAEVENISWGRAPWLFHFWLAGSLFFYCIGAKELINNFWNFHIVSPVIAVLCGRAIILLSVYPKSRPAVSFIRGFLIVGVILFSSFSLLSNLYASYWADADYKMGNALAKVKKNGDLVVTLAMDMGSPVAIYYSNCKGWTFPPMAIEDNAFDIYSFPENDTKSIELLEKLRINGANWFGIVKMQYDSLKAKQPAFINYTHQHYGVYKQTNDYVIFKLTP